MSCPENQLKLLPRLTLFFNTPSLIPVAWSFSIRRIGSGLKNRGIEQNMPSKYAMKSNVRCDENMHYDITGAS